MAKTGTDAVSPAAPLDGDCPTVHIRCGSDIRETLADAGFAGTFLEYSDPLVQGPVTAAADLPAVRARFVADAYGADLGRCCADCHAQLEGQQRQLDDAPRRYRRIVLWFEHDAFDQLALVRCLARLRAAGALPRVELISVDDFPGHGRFVGLGQLPPDALRALWKARQPVTEEQFALAAAAWQAVTAPDPRPLAAFARDENLALPYLARALRRHLAELPSRRDGLGLSERLALELFADGTRTLGKAFGALVRECDPLPSLGDVMFLHVVRTLAAAREPALEDVPAPGEGGWPRRRPTLTAAGRAILDGRRDWLAHEPLPRWVGGVEIRADRPCWRWDEAAGEVVLA